MNPVFQEG